MQDTGRMRRPLQALLPCKLEIRLNPICPRSIHVEQDILGGARTVPSAEAKGARGEQKVLQFRGSMQGSHDYLSRACPQVGCGRRPQPFLWHQPLQAPQTAGESTLTIKKRPKPVHCSMHTQRISLPSFRAGDAYYSFYY